MLAIGVVKENAIAAALVEREQKTERLVERIGRFLPSIGIGVPHGEGLVAMIERSSLVAEPEVVFGWRHVLGDTEGTAPPRDRCSIAGHWHTIAPDKSNRRASAIDANAQSGRVQPDCTGILIYLNL